MTWQPIETAPKDGTIVDLWVQGAMQANGEYSQRRSPQCHSNGWDWISPLDGDWEYGGGRMWGCRPTHWMPVPAPPA